MLFLTMGDFVKLITLTNDNIICDHIKQLPLYMQENV